MSAQNAPPSPSFEVIDIESSKLPSTQRAQFLAGGDHYNNVGLNSATGYITPKDMLAGPQQEIHAERDRKLEESRKQQQIRRQQAA